MSREKLIAKYAALDTQELPERIHHVVTEFIASEGIERLPYLELGGRWTGKLTISDGGWRGDHDLMVPVLALCRVNRHGEVLADLAKITRHVEKWREYLHTPTDDDVYMGVDDENFDEGGFLGDDENEFRSAAYRAELDSFLMDDNRNLADHDRALSEIDSLVTGEDREDFNVFEDFEDSDFKGGNDGALFEKDFHVQRIDSAEDFRRLMEAMQAEAEAGGGETWVSPDFDMAKIEEMFAERPKEDDWMEFIDNLRNGRFGELPEDYDGLEPPEEL